MKCKLGEVCDFQNGYAFKSKDFLDSGRYKVIRIKEFKDGEIRYFDDSAYIDYFSDSLKRFIANKGDVLFALTGDPVNKNNPLSWVGRVSRYNYDEIAFINQRVCKALVDENKLDKNYLYYYFRLFDNFYSLAQKATGSANQANISTKTIADMEIDLPPLSVQQTIAITLSALDTKITNNKRINHHLTAIAEAIYKSWFVDFEPFADGGFIESELGKIPVGWRVGTLDECIDFYNGYAFKSNELLNTEEDDCYHVFKMGHIKKGGGLNLDGTKSWIKRNKCKPLLKYVLHLGDLLMCMTDMKGNVALLGHTALVAENDKYIINQRVGLLRANNTHGVDYPFLYILTNYKDFLENLRGRANSGVQVNLSTAEIKASKFPLAPKEINERFDKAVKPLFQAIFNNQQESAHLATLRDTLLPRLMSGELSVADLAVK